MPRAIFPVPGHDHARCTTDAIAHAEALCAERAERLTGAWDGQWNDRWDNSGVVRPDSDPRGHTDRGEGELSDALKPTKVKGQFSPGGQMPSITLKGVSIKGQSGVAYQEAVAAAQSEAQSALNQDRVPRAYQGAVKDYFDDLKK